MNEPSTPPGRFGNTWKTRPNGLHVPAHVEMPPAKTERHKVTDWLQGIGTMIAALIAALALLVGAQTLQDQQQTNRDQMAFNEESRNRSKRRYVSRVSWWPEYVKGKPSILIQNRSPVPLNDISLEVWFLESGTGLSGEWADGATERYSSHLAVPPCSIVTLAIYSKAEVLPPGSSFGMAVDAPPAETHEAVGAMNALWLTDSQGVWRLAPGVAAELFNSPPFGGRQPPGNESRTGTMGAPDVRQEVSDCGEGG